MQCTNCGREVPNTAKVCGHCGHRLKADVPSSAPASTAAKQSLPGWVWGLAGGLLVIVSCIAIFAVMRLPKSVVPTALPPTILPPTRMPTLVPSPTQVPLTKTPTTIPISPTPESIRVEWDFDQEDIPEIDFGESENDRCSEYFEDGQFNITVKVDMRVCWDWTVFELSDGYIETKARVVEPIAHGDYGLIFHFFDGDNYYIFRVNNTGSYQLCRIINDEWNILIAWTYSGYVNTGTASNVLGVLFTGGEIKMYINGNYIDTYHDDSVKNGSVGVVAGSYGAPNVRAAFDYFLAEEK